MYIYTLSVVYKNLPNQVNSSNLKGGFYTTLSSAVPYRHFLDNRRRFIPDPLPTAVPTELSSASSSTFSSKVWFGGNYGVISHQPATIIITTATTTTLTSKTLIPKPEVFFLALLCV